MTDPRRTYTPPRQPDAEPVCTLTPEQARTRREPPDALLALARSERGLPAGAEFRFEAAPGLWERIETFVSEEQECCPFFAFEQWEEEGEVVLRITRSVEGIDTPDPSASSPLRSTPRSPQDDGKA